ncbi:MAG: hypothetical protein NTY68_04500, partial [Candidatus Micrarchaeota archaeon]|nr:hypothetical protein [Candidatus Micrarchaeota archaeon]
TSNDSVIRHRYDNTVMGLYRMFWRYGRGGMSVIERRKGIILERGWLALMKRLVFAPYLLFTSEQKGRRLSLFERAAFCFLKRVQILGLYMGSRSSGRE